MPALVCPRQACSVGPDVERSGAPQGCTRARSDDSWNSRAAEDQVSVPAADIATLPSPGSEHQLSHRSQGVETDASLRPLRLCTHSGAARAGRTSLRERHAGGSTCGSGAVRDVPSMYSGRPCSDHIVVPRPPQERDEQHAQEGQGDGTDTQAGLGGGDHVARAEGHRVGRDPAP